MESAENPARPSPQTPEPQEREVSERVLHMWEPLPFTVSEHYDYRRTSPGKRLRSALLRRFAHPILWCINGLGTGFFVRGRENLRQLEGGAVSVCNHIHPMDCTMIDLALTHKRVHYLSLADNFRIPGVRHLIRLLGAVPLTTDFVQMAALFSAMGEAVQAGDIVQIYPEGVLVPYDTSLRKFRNGAFHLAVRENCPVLPMVLTQERPTGFFALYKKKPCLRLNILPLQMPDPTLEKHVAENELRRRCMGLMRAAQERYQS